MTSSPPPVEQRDIAQGLRELGLAAGDGVMAHSSLRSFGRVAGGAQTVIAALMEVVTNEGALLMPSFNHGRLSHKDGVEYFDLLNTPTTNGAVPDLFRRLPDVYRSWNPTHSFAAWGKHARAYTQWHHRTLTLGAKSPLGRLHADDGYGLLLGVDFRVNTFHHLVETVTNAPCLGHRSEAYPMLLPDGRMVEGRTWGWRNARCPFTDQRRYHPRMASPERSTQTRIGNCVATLFRLQDCFEVIADILARGMDGFPPCADCPIRPRAHKHAAPSDWDAQKNALRPDSAALDY